MACSLSKRRPQVLTTYDALRRDVHRGADGGEARTLRRRKRYQALPTPLTRLRWWRVCLDEVRSAHGFIFFRVPSLPPRLRVYTNLVVHLTYAARLCVSAHCKSKSDLPSGADSACAARAQAQMVESSTAKAAEMAARLDAVHRWAITGTPLSRGLEDLFGLFFFLHAAPLDQRAWWTRVCQRPYEDGCPAGADRLCNASKGNFDVAGFAVSVCYDHIFLSCSSCFSGHCLIMDEQPLAKLDKTQGARG